MRRKKGLERAVRYALFPHELGLCGPQGAGAKDELYRYLTTDRVREGKVRKLLEEFWASTAYLKLIAQSNEIDDWLDERVVEAYWIGNSFLDYVRIANLREIVCGFAGKGVMTAETANAIAERIPRRAVPHHSFHVFMVGSVTGKVKPIIASQDLCRIGWGKVEKVEDNQILARAKPLVRGGEDRLGLGEARLQTIQRDPKLLSRVRTGEIITFHWGKAVEIINGEQANQLEKYTERTLGLFSFAGQGEVS